MVDLRKLYWLKGKKKTCIRHTRHRCAHPCARACYFVRLTLVVIKTCSKETKLFLSFAVYIIWA